MKLGLFDNSNNAFEYNPYATLQFLSPVSLTFLAWFDQGWRSTSVFETHLSIIFCTVFCFAVSETRTGIMVTLSTAAESVNEPPFSKELSQSPLRVSPRRVLGNISPNIRIGAPTSSAFTRNNPTTPNGSPLKAHLALTPADVLSMKGSYGYPPSVGTRKRSFAAIDGADDHEEPILKRATAGTEMTQNNGRVPSMIPVRICGPTSYIAFLTCQPDRDQRFK